MAVVINPSVNVQIVYSTEYDYNYLLNQGIATYGDLIIEASSNNGNGVLHINDTDFYFSGFAVRKNGVIVKETKSQYITSNSVNKGDIEFTGTITGDTITAPTIGFDRLIYNKTGKELATIIEGTNLVPWQLSFNKDVYLRMEDFYVGGRLFSQTYLKHEDVSALFQSKTQAQADFNLLNTSVNNATNQLKQQVNTSINEITNIVKSVDASMTAIRQLIFNTSTYYYTEPSDPTDIGTAKSIKDAIDILMYDKQYEYPEDVSVICTVDPSVFIRGKRVTGGVKFTWSMKNYITDSQYRSYTYQVYNNANTTALFNYTDTIDNVQNYETDIVKVLRIGNNHVDLYGNKAKEFVYEFRCRIIDEGYYLTTTAATTTQVVFSNSCNVIEYMEAEEGYSKFMCITYEPQYIYFALFTSDIPAFYLYETDEAGRTGSRQLEGGVSKIQTINLTKNAKTLTYTLFRTNQKQFGPICIEYKNY